MQHRNDIDGLRAIAVLSVVCFHLGFSGLMGGGFVGVDVFFVISGYLITGIVARELDEQRFSPWRFYERRVRRIFPALFAVHVACLLAAGLLLFPSEAEEVGHDVLRSLGFVSNVSFARARGDYFNQVSNVTLLLHTWSLSVEEQFYLGLPLLLWASTRLGHRLRNALLALLALVSFGLCEAKVHVAARDAFYLVQYRAWELLLGALAALGAFGRVRSRVLGECLGVVGLALIAFGVVAIGEDTAFPGVWALPPCLGALFVLQAGNEARTLTARVLGSAPLSFIGRISYSLYLWHWPLIALYSDRRSEPTPLVALALLASMVAVATLSYRYIEQPFRQRPRRLDARRTLLVAALAMAAVAALGLGVPTLSSRLRPDAKLAEKVLQYSRHHRSQIRAGTCFLDGGFDDFQLFRPDLCLALAPDRRNFLVMGDSHAAHFTPALAALHPEINFLQATASGCQAVRGGKGAAHCMRLFSFVFDEFLPKHHVDAVILAGHWPMNVLQPLLKTVRYLRAVTARVVVLGPVVEYDQGLPRLLARSILEDDPTLPLRHLRRDPPLLDKRYARPLKRAGADYYSVYDANCPHGKCRLWAAPGVPMQIDAHHLSLPGAELVLRRFGPELFR